MGTLSPLEKADRRPWDCLPEAQTEVSKVNWTPLGPPIEPWMSSASIYRQSRAKCCSFRASFRTNPNRNRSTNELTTQQWSGSDCWNDPGWALACAWVCMCMHTHTHVHVHIPQISNKKKSKYVNQILRPLRKKQTLHFEKLWWVITKP